MRERNLLAALWYFSFVTTEFQDKSTLSHSIIIKQKTLFPIRVLAVEVVVLELATNAVHK